MVAPFAGAWIEMASIRVRLKYKSSSHPSRVRGLKYWLHHSHQLHSRRTLRGCVDWNLSVFWYSARHVPCRTLRGCVDWNYLLRSSPAKIPVAPFAGAWIEIWTPLSIWINIGGRTLRGCVDWNYCFKGLLLRTLRRTLRGCVDWNSIDYLLIGKEQKVAPFAGAWIEISFV